MKHVKMLVDGEAVGKMTPARGAIVVVPDDFAEMLAKHGKGQVIAEADASRVENPDHNPLADVLDPLPVGGPVVNPVDATVPTIDHNPGLQRQVNTVGINSADKPTDAVTQMASGRRPGKRGPGEGADKPTDKEVPAI